MHITPDSWLYQKITTKSLSAICREGFYYLNPMSFYFNLGFGNRTPLSVERDRQGNWFYRMFSSGGNFTQLSTDRDKLDAILRNPAALKVFKLNPDLASLGKIYYKEENKVIDISKLQPRPNKHQTWKQFIWDYMFCSMLGTAYVWRSKSIGTTSFYLLNPAKVSFPFETSRKLDKLDLSDKSINEIGDNYIQYTFVDGSIKNIKLKEIECFFDLSNMISGNWYKGNSVIDALFKIIANNEEAIRAQNINLELSGKVMVSGTSSLGDTSYKGIGIGDTEKSDIVQKIHDNESIKVVKSLIDTKRFVDDIGALKLDEAYLHTYFVIGSAFNIPRDVLDAQLRGSTYENQEKSTGKHISYSIHPKVDDLMVYLGEYFGKELIISYSHLPFMQVFEKDRAGTANQKANTFKTLIDAGMPIDEAKKVAGIEIQ